MSMFLEKTVHRKRRQKFFIFGPYEKRRSGPRAKVSIIWKTMTCYLLVRMLKFCDALFLL